ncbi:DUF885 domain-containing protein [Brevundimonas lenta]|uniref:Uncharacterized protein (DUF885 family) n=1 Tax=Brevundimonas lenta TaxID=424796 RepID=A0A7W6NRB2_9CAUL|nr:DUF885 family protein [Brevundimonas lenta]MBB4084077.1 uncharacterized protein (DUF885 family) [Brevundimonas lenta]
MLDRRSFLVTAAVAGALAGPGRALARSQATGEAAKLNAVLEAMFAAALAESAMLATYLGVDKGENAAAKSKLDMQSDEDRARNEAMYRGFQTRLKGIDRNALHGMDRVNLDAVLFTLDTSVMGIDTFDYGDDGQPNPYRVSQLTGSYQSIPDFLDTMHSIDTAEDAEAYLSRLEAFATLLDQETALVQADFAKGIVPPDFIIERALVQMNAVLAVPPAESGLSTSVARRTAEKNIAGDWAARATAITTDKVYPALRRQAAVFEAAQPGAVHDAGVARLPNGAAYYAWGIRNYTTTNLTGDEVHELGLRQVAEISARADEILKAEGRTEGSVGARIGAIGKEPQFVWPNTPEGKRDLLESLNAQVRAMQARLPEKFGKLPRSTVEIRAVPEAIQAGAPGGYYQGPSLDGSRPGAYYINLRDTAEWPKWSLPTLTYHEAIPGHHFQGSLQIEAEGIPMIRKVIGFSAFSEGWALYSEQLADEMGVYDGDPWGRLGYLQSLLFRAVRLVVDSGLHHKGWSREQAIRYMVDTLGDQESSVTTEVERYCVWPGQASSYKIGHTEWVRLREEAQAALGDRFDIKAFHDTALASGDMPLEALKSVVVEWVQTQKA